MPTITAGGYAFDVDLIIFDKDGTLFDFHAMWLYLFERFVHALRDRFGVEEKVVEDLYDTMGVERESRRIDPLGPLALATGVEIDALLAGVLYRHGWPWDQAQDLVRKTWEAAGTPDLRELSRPIGELRQFFTSLRAAGLRLALVTTDRHDRAEEMLTYAGVRDLVDVVVGEEDVAALKPSPDGIMRICEGLGIPPARALMVGDSPTDMQAGRAAGVAGCIGVTSGVSRREDLKPYADVVLRSIHDLSVRLSTAANP